MIISDVSLIVCWRESTLALRKANWNWITTKVINSMTLKIIMKYNVKFVEAQLHDLYYAVSFPVTG